MSNIARPISEITYIIDKTLNDLVDLNRYINQNKSALEYVTAIDNIEPILKALNEVGQLIDDPVLVNKYKYLIDRAKERIDSFNDSTNYYAQLLSSTHNLTILIEELNNEMGLQHSSQTPVSSLIDKLCSFIELFYCFWSEDLYKQFCNFENLLSGMCKEKTTNCYGQIFYVDPVMQLSYFSFISTRILIHQDYLTGFNPLPYIGTFPYSMPNVWDERLYRIYGIMRPSWCI